MWPVLPYGLRRGLCRSPRRIRSVGARSHRPSGASSLWAAIPSRPILSLAVRFAFRSPLWVVDWHARALRAGARDGPLVACPQLRGQSSLPPDGHPPRNFSGQSEVYSNTGQRIIAGQGRQEHGSKPGSRCARSTIVHRSVGWIVSLPSGTPARRSYANSMLREAVISNTEARKAQPIRV